MREPLVETKKVETWQARHYILLATLGGIFYGMTNFIVGLISVKNAPPYVVFPYGFGYVIFWLCYHSTIAY